MLAGGDATRDHSVSDGSSPVTPRTASRLHYLGRAALRPEIVAQAAGGIPTMPAGCTASLALRQVYGRGTAVLLLLDIKSDLLALAETPQTRFLHGADMDKDVLSPGIRCDEAIALCRIEPLHGAVRHRRVAFLPASGAVRKPRAAQLNSSAGKAV